jgi:hypothetical protein
MSDLNFDDYKVKLPFPSKPKPPLLSPNHTIQDVQQYATSLKDFEAKDQFYREEIKRWRQEEYRLLDRFKEDVLNAVGLKGKPYANLLYSKAWEEGHSAGLEEVFHYLDDYADFVNAVFKSLENNPVCIGERIIQNSPQKTPEVFQARPIVPPLSKRKKR